MTRRGRYTALAFAAPLAIMGATLAVISQPPAVQAGIRCPHAVQVSIDLPLCTHGNDPATSLPGGALRASGSPGASSGSAPATTGRIVCDGDGKTGKRVQVIMARASDVTGTPPATSTVVGWAQGTDGIFDASAAQTGGSRHLRYVTNPDCTLNIESVVLPADADDSFSNTITAMQNAGYDSTDRKYLMFMDSSVYCGIGIVTTDDAKDPWNRANTTTGYARVDRPCWNAGTAAHELGHNLGAVQMSAPHSDGGWHCNTEWENLCYGGQQTYICPESNEQLLDCGHDDYYLAGTPAPGDYLASHWNLADSAFLIGGVNPGPSPTPSPSPTRRCVVLLIRICR